MLPGQAWISESLIFSFPGLGNTFVNETLFYNGSQVRDPSPQRADWRDQLESLFFCENEA
jgi:hypothetical protein